MKLSFIGHSDDTFGEYGVFQDDYDCCASGRPIVWEVKCGDEGLFVFGQYGGRDWPSKSPGCWMIGVQQLDEDIPLPNWPMQFRTADSGYSPELLINAPDGTVIRCVNLKVDTD